MSVYLVAATTSQKRKSNALLWVSANFIEYQVFDGTKMFSRPSDKAFLSEWSVNYVNDFQGVSETLNVRGIVK